VLRPRAVDANLVPVAQLESLGHGRWRSTGNDPQFEIRFPARTWGDVELVMEIDTEDLGLRPVLYVDSGTGFSEQGRIDLPWAAGRVQGRIWLPPTLTALRFDPTDRASEFTLRSARLVERGTLTRVGEGLGPALRTLFRSPAAARESLGELARTLRDRGLAEALADLLGLRPSGDTGTFAEWASRFDTLGENDRREIRSRVQALHSPPLISVVLPVHAPPEDFLRRAVDSVRSQLYPHWELCIADDASPGPGVRTLLEQAARTDRRIRLDFRSERGHISAASNSALALATGRYVTFLDHDDELPEHALASVAHHLATFPGARLVYSDEDKIDATGRRFEPAFKPDWSPELLRHQNYVAHLAVFLRDRVLELGGFRTGFEGSQDHDLVLRYAEGLEPGSIHHLPEILYHWRWIPTSTSAGLEAKPYAATAGVAAVRESLGRSGIAGEVSLGEHPGTYRVTRRLPDEAPLVSLIIPTRDGGQVLRRCVASVLERTDYPAIELVLVDNDSRDTATLAYLSALEEAGRARVLRFPGAFNYSAINDFAVEHAAGELICLLNDDTEVISPGWLAEMAALALAPDVGAVGAKLYYGNDTVQHGGVVAGLSGLVDHLFRHHPRRPFDRLGRLAVVREVSAVTGACLLIRRELFREIGGLDAQELPIAFNDVDLCFRLRERGYRNLWTPHAELYHHESTTRGSDERPEQRERFKREAGVLLRRWQPVLSRDPYFNPNLSLRSYELEVAWPPRVERFWRAST
jgi:GT2 family glycosyltransferase